MCPAYATSGFKLYLAYCTVRHYANEQERKIITENASGYVVPVQKPYNNRIYIPKNKKLGKKNQSQQIREPENENKKQNKKLANKKAKFIINEMERV